MWLPAERTGPDSPHRISFRWGDKDLKSKNFIACKGQRVELGKANGRVATLHILAASTGKDAVSSLKLIFQEPTSQSEDLYSFLVSRWDQPPTHGEEVAYLSPPLADADRRAEQRGRLVPLRHQNQGAAQPRRSPTAQPARHQNRRDHYGKVAVKAYIDHALTDMIVMYC